MMERSSFQKILIAVWTKIYQAINSVFYFLSMLIRKYVKLAISQIKNNG